MQRISVYLIDDHPIMLETIAQYVGREAHVVGTAPTPEEALADERISSADVVLVDVSLPRMSGIDLVQQLLGRFPDLRCVMLSGHDAAAYIDRSLAVGARGYLTKSDPFEILEAIRIVHSGRNYVSERLRRI